MFRIALQMLIGDRAKYLGLVLGIAFSTLLITQQSSIFAGAMRQTVHSIVDAPGVDLWVMRRGVETPEDADPLPESSVKRVASVPGVAWAVPYYKTMGTLRTHDGRRRGVLLVGVDDATMVAAPPVMVLGSVAGLRRTDGVILDTAAYAKIFPNTAVDLGGTFEIGNRRATVVGICRARAPFNGADIVYARRSLAVEMAKEANNTVSFILARVQNAFHPPDVARDIERQTSFRAFSADDFATHTINWNLENSGITEVLGAAIVLGLIVGVVIVGQTFYMFSVENARQFATLKAMGLSNGRVLLMMLAQAVFVACIGFGLGAGGTVLFFIMMADDASPLRGMSIEPDVLIGSAVVVVGMTVASAMFSARRVLTVEPGIVFRGG